MCNPWRVLLTFLHSGYTHRWLTQAGLCLPLALVRVVHLHRGKWGLLLIHAPEHHHLAPERQSWGPCPRCWQRWQLAPCLALNIQDLSTVQGHAGLVAAPQHVKQAFVVHRSAIDTALWHGGELLPVKGLDRTHRHLLHRHVSTTERRGRTITHGAGEDEWKENGSERGDVGGGGRRPNKRWTQLNELQEKQDTGLFLVCLWVTTWIPASTQGKKQRKVKDRQREGDVSGDEENGESRRQNSGQKRGNEEIVQLTPQPVVTTPCLFECFIHPVSEQWNHLPFYSLLFSSLLPCIRPVWLKKQRGLKRLSS